MSEENKEINQNEGNIDKKIEGSIALDISVDDVLRSLFEAYKKSGTNDDKEKFAEIISKWLRQAVGKHACSENYNLLILFDNSILIKSDADHIYKAIGTFNNKKPLLLVLLSRGGEPGSAYLIGKLCREFCNDKFIVVVPRYAKSAATLLATAADEIHMGSLSELGPIDPQINKRPALGLKNSVEHIAELVNKMPQTSQMFAKYLSLSIEPIQIGYYERVAESAVQYAERLFSSHKKKIDNASEAAYKLVYGYKDHGFVIDKNEAISIFGADIIKSNSDEYLLGNEIYTKLAEVENLAKILDYNFSFIGSLDANPILIKNVD